MAADEHPYDTMCARIIQARAVVLSITNGYDVQTGFGLSDKHIQEALWAVDELLTQAHESCNKDIDDRLAKRAA